MTEARSHGTELYDLDSQCCVSHTTPQPGGSGGVRGPAAPAPAAMNVSMGYQLITQ